MKWYNRLWVKFLLEVVITTLLWMLFTVFRKLLPKKYRVKDKKIRSLILDLGIISTNLAGKDDTVGNVIIKAKNLFNHFYEKYNHSSTNFQELTAFAEDLEEDVEVVNNYGFVNLVLPKLKHISMSRVMELNTYNDIVEMVFMHKGEPKKFYLIRNQGYTSSTATYDNNFIVPKGFNPMSLVNSLFDTFDNKIMLSYVDGALTCSKLEFPRTEGDINKPLFDKLLTEINTFKARGIQRSYLIPGPPGTGKTSFCVELSLAVSDRVVMLDSSVFIHLSSSNARAVLENLDCEFLIVDDIDRINKTDASTVLYALTSLKTYAHRPTLFATCNSMKGLDEAFIRPGRFDDIIDGEFDLPDQTARKLFFKKFLDNSCANLTEAQYTKLAKVTQGMSQSYLLEYCQQFRSEICGFDAVIAKIERRMKYLVKPEDKKEGKSSNSKSNTDNNPVPTGGTSKETEPPSEPELPQGSSELVTYTRGMSTYGNVNDSDSPTPANDNGSYEKSDPTPANL